LINGRLGHLVCEARLISADGSVRWMDLRADPCVLGDGEVIGVLATLHEITSRKKVEETAAAARRLPTSLLANFPGMVYRARNDADWTMDFVSDGSLELTGFEPFELVKNARTSYAQLIHPDDREFVRQQGRIEPGAAQTFPDDLPNRRCPGQGMLGVGAGLRRVFLHRGGARAGGLHHRCADARQRRRARVAAPGHPAGRRFGR